MLLRESSNVKTPTNSQSLLPNQKSDPDSNNSSIIDDDSSPVVVYRIREDRVEMRSRFYQLSFSIVLVVSSIILFVIAIWIEYWIPQFFSSHLLKTGALYNFSLHYALVLDAVLGLVASSLFLGMRTRNNFSKYILPVVNITGFCCLWAFLTMVYSFGANILYENELEEVMVKEMKSSGENSVYWTNSQNFFRCCGVSSYKSWDWNVANGKIVDVNENNRTYPISCCDVSISKESCKVRPSKSNTFVSGCLESEMDFLLGLVYAIILLVSLHFFLELFALMSTVKVHLRQRLCRELYKLEESKELSSSVRRLSLSLEHGTLSEKTFVNNEFESIDSQVKRSSTL